MSRPLPSPRPPPPSSRPLPFPVHPIPHHHALPYNPYNPSVYNRPPSPTKRPLPLSPSGSTVPLAPPSSRRPLPFPAPGQKKPLPQPQYSDPVIESSDSEASEPDEQPPPASPQYGIRDLPSRRTQTSPPESMTLRFADLDLQASNGRQQRSAAPPPSWPVDVNPLPRPPTSPHRHDPPTSAFRPPPKVVMAPVSAAPDLDDAPPHPSLPRKPFPRSDMPNNNNNNNSGISARRHPPPRWMPSPPAPVHTSPHFQPNIASPAPLNGRHTRADIPALESTAPPVDSRDRGHTDRQASAPEPNSYPAITIALHEEDDNDTHSPSVSAPSIHVDSPPTISISGPTISISVSSDPQPTNSPKKRDASLPPVPVPMNRAGGLVCGSCGGAIIGRIVHAMGVRWHPGCFRCTVCQTLLEHVSSYERDGRPYCHLDYHEKFAPRCYSCKTAIVDERFITLNDPGLGGQRMYHEQHFFCAECGDPFLDPSSNPDEDVDNVGFIVYRGHPYCEACHIRLRMPRCRKCKRSIRDDMQAVEALGGKWCWGCFVCEGCERPFEEPSFFQREGLPFCERCFSIILKNEL